MVRASAIGIVAGLIPFVLVLWNLGVDPLRTAYGTGTFSNFYDIQARALLDGNMDVPPGSLGIEEFVVRGRSYMYFPPFPALIRIPVLLLTDSLDGDLTAISMLAGWSVFAVATALMIWIVRGKLRGPAPIGRVEAAIAAILIAALTGGSTMLYLASQPFVFHEVYIWSAALTVSTAVALLAIADAPTGGRVVACGLLATATILTRAPAGWAMALTMIAVAVWIRVARPTPRAKPLGQLLTGAAVAAMVIGASVNWVKFHHAYRFTIADQVWSQINPARQATLAANGDRLDGIQFLPTTIVTYFRPDGIRFVPYLPFVTMPARPPSAVGDVVLDQTYRTGSITSFMLLLFIATIWGATELFRWRRGDGLTPLRIVAAGCLVATFPVLAFSYITFRYTADFLPLLTIGAALAFAKLGRRLARTTRMKRKLALFGIATLATYGLVVNVAVAIVDARVATRGDSLVDLIVARDSVGEVVGAPADLVEVDQLPPRGDADRVAIVGDCDAAFLGTGGNVDSWVLVEQRGLNVTLQPLSDGEAGTAEVGTFTGVHDRILEIERNEAGRFRFRVVDQAYVAPGEWFDAVDDEPIAVRISADTGRGRWAIATNTGFATDTVLIEPSPTGTDLFVGAEAARRGRSDMTEIGLSLSSEPGPPPSLCERLR